MNNCKLMLSTILILTSGLLFISPQNVKFSVRQPAADDSYKYTTKYQVEINASAKLKNQGTSEVINSKFGSIEDKIIRIKVLNVENDKVNKAEVFYEIAEEISRQGDEIQKKPHVVNGKTYIVEIINNEKTVSCQDSRIPDKEEIDYIDIDSLFDFKGFSENLVGMELKPGIKTPLLKSALLSYLSDSNNDTKIKKTDFYLKEVKSESNRTIAVFSIEFTADVILDANSSLSMIVKGDLLVDTDDINIYELKMDGDLTMKSKEKDMTMKGKGPVSFFIKQEKIINQ